MPVKLLILLVNIGKTGQIYLFFGKIAGKQEKLAYVTSILPRIIGKSSTFIGKISENY